MYLLIDTISDPSSIVLFNENREIIDVLSWTAKHQEFDTLVESIDTLLTKNSLEYSAFQGIVVTVGPGGFTGTRITTLVANTLAFDYQIPLFALEVSDIFSCLEVKKPWVMPITKREAMIWNEVNNSFEIILKDQMPSGSYTSLMPFDTTSPDSTITLVRDYDKLIKNLHLKNPTKRVVPLYARDPNITKKT